MRARWGYEVRVGSDGTRGYRDARTQSLIPRRMPGAVADAIHHCMFHGLVRAPSLALGFFLVWFGIAFNVGYDDPRTIMAPTVMVVPGGLLVVRLFATALLLAQCRPHAARTARGTMLWLRLHQVLVAVALPPILLLLDGPGLAFWGLVITLAVSRVVWSSSALLEDAARVLEGLDAQPWR